MITSRRAARLVGPVLAAAVTLSTLSPASAAEQPPAARNASVTRAAATISEFRFDTTGAQASEFDPSEVDLSDEQEVADLVEAISVTAAIPLRPQRRGYVSTPGQGLTVEVTASGNTTVIGPEGRLGISAAPGVAATEAGGALVQEQVAPGTDLVTRAVPGGVQLVAVLADRQAPTRIPFRLNLPDGWTLTPAADGSVHIEAPDRSLASRSGITAADALGTGAPEEGQPIATLVAPWAFDATGAPVDTHYEVRGRKVVQVVEPTADTVYPVTADPNVLWWAWTATACAASLAPIVFGGAAAIGTRLVRIQRYVNSHARIKALVNTLGGVRGMLRTMRDAALGLARGSVYRYLTRQHVIALSAIGSNFMGLLADLLGIGSCATLIREAL